MTGIIETSIIISASTLGYIFMAKKITKYLLNEGKSEKEIIEKYTSLEKVKVYQNKYPEANIRSARNIILAFGFIFAFACGLYAFNSLGKQKRIILGAPEEPNEILIEKPFRFAKKKKEVPKELPKKIKNPVLITGKDLPDIPDIIDSISFDIDSDTSDLNGNPSPIVDDPQPLKIDKKYQVESEEMPKFRGCENLSESEARNCTNEKIQYYISQMELPQGAQSEKLFIKFIIGKNKQVQDVEVIKGENKRLIQAAMKHINRMPKFAKAGMQRGKPVRIQYIVPINIILD